MPILKKKNKSDLPTEKELAALDGSVDELNRQTKQLLKGFGESTTTKKIAPEHDASQKVPTKAAVKKAHTPVKKGSARSFDIIHTPPKKLQASLKTRPTTERPQPELLPSEASLSYNETIPEKTVSHEAPTIVHPHATGTLHIAGNAAQKDETKDDKPADESLHEPHLSLENVTEKTAAKKDIATKPLTLREKKEEKPEDSLADIKKEDTDAAPEATDDVVTEAETEDNVAEEDSVVTKEEAYSHSTTRSVEPKSYSAVEGQELPTVFDTSEYHPELHDWSKLEQRHHVSWYMLLLLLIIAGVFAYFIFSGKPLPFIG